MFVFLFQLTLNLISPSKVVKERESEDVTKILTKNVGTRSIFLKWDLLENFFLNLPAQIPHRKRLEHISWVLDSCCSRSSLRWWLSNCLSCWHSIYFERCHAWIRLRQFGKHFKKFMFQSTDKWYITVLSQYSARIFQGFWCNLNWQVAQFFLTTSEVLHIIWRDCVIVNMIEQTSPTPPPFLSRCSKFLASVCRSLWTRPEPCHTPEPSSEAPIRHD